MSWRERDERQREVLTTGEVAKLCHVVSRTVAKWIDQGLLPGYRIPGGQDRRVRRKDLIAFAQRHDLDAALAHLESVPVCLLAGCPPATAELLREVLPGWEIRTVADLFGMGLAMRDPPRACVVDLELGPRDEVRRAVRKLVEDCQRVTVLLPDDVPEGVLRPVFEGDGARVLLRMAPPTEIAVAVTGEPVLGKEVAG